VTRLNQSDGKSKKIPLLVSVWGNDFTLHARSTHLMDRYTRQTLRSCEGLHTDCKRDQDLASEMGFPQNKPKIVLPGGGGVNLDVFHPVQIEDQANGEESTIDDSLPMIINARGFRAYVRNDTFFHAIPLVLKANPHVRFICPGMAGESQAQKWITELGIASQVDLLPLQSQEKMAELFRQSQIHLSITTHDGTPNSLLEAMASGCFPIAGDIESLREWIIPGVNGSLVDPGDPAALAEVINNVLSQPEMRKQARELNLQLVKERGEYGKTMQLADDFYKKLIG